MSYEAYLAKFEQHIEGKGDINLREPLEVSDSDEDILSRPSLSRGSKKPTTPRVTGN